LLKIGGALTEASRAHFFGRRERARVLAGNYIEFSLPRTVQRGTGPLWGLTNEMLVDIRRNSEPPNR
jgi:hypothetical protein